MLKEILPPFVAVADITDSEVEVRLFPEEEAAVRAASTKRRRDFALGRHCAHRALAALGASCGPLLNDPSRAPRWPQGFVGSITHCTGYCAAAVASKQDVKSIGIDAEPARPLPPGVLGLIAHHEEEKTWIESHPDYPWDRLLFSAKESVFKMWFPLTGQWLGFEQARVSFLARSQSFTATLLVPDLDSIDSSLRIVTGRYVQTDQLVGTAIVV
ncbi:MAG: 4'-phosphopantetheinyl transferase superfamily protein [Gammaproteobacteria bacterium]|nr:4'-phosphopantetheinyl transferase superfamily protein [Gammaproteobacteria bacterium]